MEEKDIQLYEEIFKWLNTSPSKEDILKYVRSLPENEQARAAVGADYCVTKLLAEKNRYFTENKAQDFLKLPENEQYQYLVYFSAYNKNSVVSNILSRYKNLDLASLPDSVSNWSQKYTDCWDSALYMMTAQNQLTANVYINSFARLNLSLETIKGMKEKFHSYLLRNGALIERGDDPMPTDSAEESSFLNKTNMFPPAFVENIMSPSRIMQKMEMYRHLYQVCLAYEASTTSEEAVSAESASNALWELLRNHAEITVLEDIAADTFAESEKGKYARSFFQYFHRLWTLSLINEGHIDEAIIGHISKYGADEKKEFFRLLTDFLCSSTEIEVILDPLESYVVIHKIAEKARSSDITQYCENIVQQLDAAQQPVAKKLLRQICHIYEYI